MAPGSVVGDMSDKVSKGFPWARKPQAIRIVPDFYSISLIEEA